MKLRYTPQALHELDQILTDIALQSPQGARRVQSRIQTMTELLLQFPDSGQLTTVKGMRRLIATPYRYLAFYRKNDNDIVIVGIRHGARHPSSAPSRKR